MLTKNKWFTSKVVKFTLSSVYVLILNLQHENYGMRTRLVFSLVKVRINSNISVIFQDNFCISEALYIRHKIKSFDIKLLPKKDFNSVFDYLILVVVA